MIIEIPDWIKLGRCSSCAFRQLDYESEYGELTGMMDMTCPFILYKDQPDEWLNINVYEENVSDHPKGCPVKIIKKGSE